MNFIYVRPFVSYPYVRLVIIWLHMYGKKHIFFDTVLAMGSRSSSYYCQFLTNTIVFIMFKIGISVLNYLVDLALAEKKHLAEFSYKTLTAILHKCGTEARKKLVLPPQL